MAPIPETTEGLKLWQRHGTLSLYRWRRRSWILESEGCGILGTMRMRRGGKYVIDITAEPVSGSQYTEYTLEDALSDIISVEQVFRERKLAA